MDEVNFFYFFRNFTIKHLKNIFLISCNRHFEFCNTFDVITKHKSLNEKILDAVTVYNKKLAKYIIAVFKKVMQ